ncbi:MAG TPA: ABC transporter substrate-binding protein [Burkholderiaceae bacterium]|nr:ABC transporter substrate-binding protein [Burkholderiaceae bacterium]
MKMFKTLVAGACLLVGSAAQAEITIGAVLPLTGPASGLGIPSKNALALWPKTIAGEPIKLIVLDDATDPSTGAKNARRLVSENQVDLIVGSVATPVAVAIADVALETQTPQFALSPAELPPGKDAWTFRATNANAVMAHAVVGHMKKQGVRTVAFIGYNDTYGESWLKELRAATQPAGITVTTVERFARTDTSVTAQALRVTAGNPDAIFVVASGSGAAMPQLAIEERGYKGKVYQSQSAATRDLMRIGGKSVEGTFVVSGPAVAPEQLPATHPSKAVALGFVQAYEQLYGANSRNLFAADNFGITLILEKALPEALKKAKPGTPEFRAALKAAVEAIGPVLVPQGVVKYSATDHWGFQPGGGVVLKVVGGDWKVEP